MSIQESISNFFRIVDKVHLEIQSIPDPFFFRVLQLTLLDTISRAAFPKFRSNKKRFVSLIDQYSDWTLAHRYSLRQFHLLLEDIDDNVAIPGIDALRSEITERIARWPSESKLIFPEDVDPHRDDLSHLLTPVLNKRAEKVRFPSLLWKLRNFAIHELRNPGAGFDFELPDPTPYYHKLTHIDGITKTWELYFPNRLLSHLSKTCIENLEANFYKSDIDPWVSFPYDPRWY